VSVLNFKYKKCLILFGIHSIKSNSKQNFLFKKQNKIPSKASKIQFEKPQFQQGKTHDRLTKSTGRPRSKSITNHERAEQRLMEPARSNPPPTLTRFHVNISFYNGFEGFEMS
jgi:hypothetical protein